MDVGRCGRNPYPRWLGAVRRGRQWRDTSRDPVHGAEDPARVRVASPSLRLPEQRPHAAPNGTSPATARRRAHLYFFARRAGDSHGIETIWDDPRGQRVTMVYYGRARSGMESRAVDRGD